MIPKAKQKLNSNKNIFQWFTNTSTLKRLKKRKGLLFLVLVLSFIAVITISLVLGSADPFSIFLGFLGIVVSWVIFLYVKREDEIQHKESKDKIDQINGLLKDYSSIVPIPGLRNRLSAIADIYKHCFQHENDLYIMTNNVFYGKVLAHEIKSITKDVGRENKHIDTLAVLYSYDMGHIQDKIKKLKDSLIKANRPANNKIRLITLETKRHRRMVEKIIGDRKVIAINGGMDDIKNPNHKFDIENRDFLNSFLLDNSENEHSPQVSLKEELINHFENDNEKDYFFLENNDVELITVSYMPFQFVASIPRESNESNMAFEGKCVMMFSNLYGASGDEATAFFSSINDRLIKNLQFVFNDIVKKHEKIKNAEEEAMKFFGITHLEKICFVLHKAKWPHSPESKGEISIRFADDIKTESKLKSILKRTFKDHQDLLGDVVFTDADFNFEDDFSTIITIGLFENKLTEKLIRKGKTGEIVHEGTFYIDEDEKGRTIYVQDVAEKKEIPFLSSYNDMNSLERHDYALFGKIKCKNPDDGTTKSVIICGGCEGYGTKKMGQYIFSNFKRMIADQENSKIKTCYASATFISIYKIPFQSDGKVTLEYHL